MIGNGKINKCCFFLQKHHYRELEQEVRESLGKLPDGFVTYWLKRFPLLLPHVWLQMQQYREEDILQAYYPHSFVFSRDDVAELSNDTDCEELLPSDIEKNELFLKSRIYYDENDKDKKYYRKEGSPRKRNVYVSDWRSEAQSVDLRVRHDDVRMRDKHYLKKKEKKREEVPVWSLPPQ